ncbi:ATP-binding protein [Aquipuribacter sp. SD81]|uniref:ATP-binding protein n=1 Tax=Aquipuribacter sp. SD81 TaxID=3127703 RepID=UPI003016192C
MQFVGRRAELDRLTSELGRSGDAGRILVVRGRRQVGKSTLLEQFRRQVDVPSVFFAAAAGATPGEELRAFVDEVAGSTLEAAAVMGDARPASWEAALRLLAASTTTPSVVVIDELPYLLRGDPGLEGVLQRVWDRHLSRAPVLLVLIGSETTVMELLTSHGHPLFGRAGELRVDPLAPRDVAALLDLPAGDAIEATVVTGGLPRLAQEWRAGGAQRVEDFVAQQLQDATSPLVVLGERYLRAEFPTTVQAERVLRAVGSGATTFQRLSERTGLNQGSLHRSLQQLLESRLLAVDRPLSTATTRLALYRVHDNYLRFWLRYVPRALDRVERGRGDEAAASVLRDWASWRGAAVEPLVARCLAGGPPVQGLPDARSVGRFWTRDHSVEVDLVLADAPSPPTQPLALGTIKWRERAPVGHRDVASLAQARAVVPGAAEAVLFAVGRTPGPVPDGLARLVTADDLLR